MAATAGLDLLVVVDHSQARLYAIEVSHAAGAAQVIKPHHPHHVSHAEHERGQSAPDDAAFYARIVEALAGAARIVVIGHGNGRSNAANHLMDVLKRDHPEIATRVVAERRADLPGLTEPQLLILGDQALHRQQLLPTSPEWS